MKYFVVLLMCLLQCKLIIQFQQLNFRQLKYITIFQQKTAEDVCPPL